jgi:transposase InsO family protein
MTERHQFIAQYDSGLYSLSELAARFGISRKTAYKWLARYQEHGREGLLEHSRAPHSCPHRTPEHIVDAIRAARELHPSWGPRKLRPWLERHHPELASQLPAPSTIGDILQREGLLTPKPHRRRWPHPNPACPPPQSPNAVWSADFKGQFCTADGQACYPLTIEDGYSRFLFACQALPSVARVGVQPIFERVFEQYGLPDAIRTDNGPPFASTAICGLTRLNVWWLKLGIRHQRIEPGHPQQNGRHERMHRTLRAATLRPPADDHAAQQGRFDHFLNEYNTERPHEALGNQTPASVYRPSLRPYPARMPEPSYAGHFQVRQVSNAGCFRFHTRQIFISDALIKEHIGLEESADGIWSVWFYDVLLARLDERDYKLYPGAPKNG